MIDRTKERLQLAIEATGLGIWEFDPATGNFILDDRCKAVFGLLPDSVTTYQSFLDRLHLEDRERTHQAIQGALCRMSDCLYVESRAIGLSDGVDRWMELRGRATFDGAGRAGRLVGTVLDITGRKRTEDRLREQQEWLSTTLTSIGDAVIATDGRGLVRFLNPIAEGLTGWTQGEAVGKPIAEVFHIVNEATRKLAENPVDRVIREGVIVGLANHTVVIARDGTETAIEDRAAPIKDRAGQVVGVVMVFQDATERRRHEEAQRASEERHRTILANITDAFYALDKNWRFVYVNPLAEVELDRSNEDLLGKDLWEEYPATLGTEIEHQYRRAVAEQVAVSLETFYPPHDRWYEIRAHPSSDGLSVYFRDVTVRRRQEDALREGERQFRTLADSIPQLAWMARPDGFIYWYNARWHEYTGTTPEEMEGWGWQKVHDPEALPSVMERWTASIDSGEPFDMVFPLRGADGLFRPFLTRIMPVRGQDGRVVHWFGTNTDIADRQKIEDELKAAKEEAEAANQAKTQFLAVLSHELRTPLNPILLATSTMLERPFEHDEVRPMLEMIRQNVNLQARLIDDLLDVMRIVRGKMPLHWEVADCHKIIEQAIQICLSEVSGHHLCLTVEPIAENHYVNADAARLQQVFWNLIKNAVKFTPEGGTIHVRTRNDSDPGVPGGRIVIEVTDTGIGIESDILSTIWDPFQQGETTITRRFGGLGLGLAICKGVVEAHGGTLEAESAGRDRGTTFRLVLKAVPEQAAEVNGEPTAALLDDVGDQRISRRILVVEDEPATLRLMARLLRGLGHTVTTASTIASAFEAFSAGEFDLIVSDVGLPDGTGLELMRRIVALRGCVPAIALTGYGMEEDILRSREAGFTAHMTKPIDFTKLEAMIRQVATGASSR